MLSDKEKAATLHRHAARQWEEFCRQAHPGAGRYWEKDVELDLVWRQPMTGRYLVAECKWARLTAHEEQAELRRLRDMFGRTKLSRSLERVEFRVFTKNDLPRLARE
jgi:hypothetical protein